MKCRMRRQLSAYQVGLLDARRAAVLEHHLRDCPDCRRELRALQRTADLLTPAAMGAAPADLWPAIRGRLKPRNRHLPAWQWRPALATALVVVLLVGVLTGWPLLSRGASLPLVPPGETVALDQVQLAAVWDTPLADRSALGLAMLAVMDEGPESQGVVD